VPKHGTDAPDVVARLNLEMIVCSCNVVSEADLDCALMELMRLPAPPLPTPGLVLKHLSARMNCCGCAPLLVTTIYQRLARLEQAGLVHPELSADMRLRLVRMGADPRPAVARTPANDLALGDAKLAS
jgi:hypothetical protein